MQIGTWEPVQVWEQPFNPEQMAKITALPSVGDGVVAVVAVRPLSALGHFWVFPLPAPVTLDGWVSEAADGEAWEIQFGTMTDAELEALPDDFDGW